MVVPDSPGQPCPAPCSFSRGLPQGTQVRPNEPDSFKQGACFKQGVGGEGGGEPAGGAASGPGSLEGSGCSEGVRGSGGSSAGGRRSPPPRPGNPQQAAAGGFCRGRDSLDLLASHTCPWSPCCPLQPMQCAFHFLSCTRELRTRLYAKSPQKSQGIKRCNPAERAGGGGAEIRGGLGG